MLREIRCPCWASAGVDVRAVTISTRRGSVAGRSFTQKVGENWTTEPKCGKEDEVRRDEKRTDNRSINEREISFYWTTTETETGTPGQNVTRERQRQKSHVVTNTEDLRRRTHAGSSGRAALRGKCS